jgi:hypothetical protein
MRGTRVPGNTTRNPYVYTCCIKIYAVVYTRATAERPAGRPARGCCTAAAASAAVRTAAVIARNIIVGMLVELQGTPHLESGGCEALHHG